MGRRNSSLFSSDLPYERSLMNLIERSRALVPARISARIPALTPVLLLLALLGPLSIAAPVEAAVQDTAQNGVTMSGRLRAIRGERRTAAAIIGRTTTWTGSMRAVRTRP